MGFYKGVLSPLACRPFMYSVLFASYGAALRRLEQREVLNDNELLRHLVAGAFGGACYANVSFLFDTLKVRAQEHQRSSIRYLSELKHLVQKEGVAGFTRGWKGMLLRETASFSIYFAAFEQIKTILQVKES